MLPMECARHLFGVVVPVKAVCDVYSLLCKFSIADLKLLIEFTLRTAVYVCNGQCFCQ